MQIDVDKIKGVIALLGNAVALYKPGSNADEIAQALGYLLQGGADLNAELKAIGTQTPENAQEVWDKVRQHHRSASEAFLASVHAHKH